MENDKTSKDYEVCLCRHVTRGQIEDIVRETGIRDLNILCKTAHAGDKCGGCREMMEDIMNEVNSEIGL